MFKINYYIANSNVEKVSIIDQMSLRYDMFLGGIVLTDRDNQIPFNWDWIPVLDFAFCLITILNKFLYGDSENEEFEFTESERKLYFVKEGNNINIRTSFSEDHLKVPFEDFRFALYKFFEDVILNIYDKNPHLKNDSVFVNYLKKYHNSP